ncbi:hypothetical protein B6U83_02305 [Thermoplasmatales archaeon ex4484_36]|nr:MAG: hypothetical protein B6U83_02305 [Thermoplasmatales archaeon ex4484_36]
MRDDPLRLPRRSSAFILPLLLRTILSGLPPFGGEKGKNALYVVEILIPSLLPFPLGPETFLIDLLLIALLFVLIIRRRSAGR